MERKNKVIAISEIANYVHENDRVAFGGFAIYQKPMAIVREIARQKIKNLTIVGVVNSLDADLLIGAKCIKNIETSYVGLEKYGLASNYRRAVQNGDIQVDYYPEMLSWDRFRADREGWPYWPAYYLGGCDVVLRNPKIVEYKCPVSNKKCWALPAAKPDVVFLHAYQADIYGNVQVPSSYMLPQYQDIDFARSCDNIVVSVEKIVSTEEIMKNPNRTVIPAFKTKAIILAPNGSHPCSTLHATKEDREHMQEYADASKDETLFNEYLNKYVYMPKDNEEYRKLFVDSELLKEAE